MNASFSRTPHLVARAACTRKIGRPNFPEITPSVAESDPDAIAANKIITVINSALQPWSADNYDLSFEVYEVRVDGPTDSLSGKA